ncbi:MAG: hypothetical protein RI900_2544 [Actinomycetota bacterium]
MSTSRWVGSIAFATMFANMVAPHALATQSSDAEASPAVAERIGAVTVVEADRRGVVVARGGSTNEFSLVIPRESTCPGDSKHDDWRVQTFIVPEGVDPGGLGYGPNGPTGERQWALYDTFGSPVIEGLLVPNESAGSAARIDMFPPMSFRVFPPGEIPPGTYRVGAACTRLGETGPYWDTQVEFSADPGDQPGQLAWSVPGAPEVAPDHVGTSSSPPWTAIFVIVAVLAFGFAFFVGRKSGRPSRSLR